MQPARWAKICVLLAMLSGVLIFVDVAAAVTTAAKGLFIVFVVLCLFFVTSTGAAVR
jgi:uncharacterized membrane protein YtjA (UPF0391 family)